MSNYSSIENRNQSRKPHSVSQLKVCTLFILGLFFIVLAAVVLVLWPTYYQNIIADQLTMTPDSKTFEAWENSPVPIYIEFFFFNWTNINTFEEDGERHIPQFQELGPYRYKQTIERVNVTWNDNNTMTYQQAKHWYFDPDNSNGSIDDEITTLNAVALTAAFTALRDWGPVMQTTASAAISMTQQRVHVVKTVRELLFDGYSDPLITMAQATAAKTPFDKFAWFYKRNGTTFMDGVFNMNTGAENISQMGKLENWNYGNSTSFYDGECANVVGTTEQLFPPGQTRDAGVTIFAPDLCRSVTFEYEDDTEVEGVLGYRYVGGVSMFENGTIVANNTCFCIDECVPSGVVNVMTCRFGSPAYASFPHYYLADPFFLSRVQGLKPIKEKHQFYIVLEPITGAPLDVAARLQVNMLLQPLPGMSLYENVPTVFFPMIWFQQRVTITSSLAWELRLLLLLQHLGLILSGVAALGGCLMVGYSLVLCLRNHKARTMQMQKGKDDYDMYVAAMDSPDKERNGTKQYIVMKPRSEMSSVKL